MPELTTPDGTPVKTAEFVKASELDRDKVNQEFSRALASEEPSAAQPPPRREQDGEAPKQPPKRGRRPASDKSRTETERPPQKSSRNFTEEVAGLTTLAWAALAATPYTSAYAVVIEANQPQLVAAGNAACQNNAQIRETVTRWAAGGGGVWMLQLAAVGTNMTVQAMQILRDPELREASRKHTEGKFRDFLRSQGVKLPGDEPAPQEAPADAPVAA